MQILSLLPVSNLWSSKAGQRGEASPTPLPPHSGQRIGNMQKSDHNKMCFYYNILKIDIKRHLLQKTRAKNLEYNSFGSPTQLFSICQLIWQSNSTFPYLSTLDHFVAPSMSTNNKKAAICSKNQVLAIFLTFYLHFIKFYQLKIP